MPRDPATLVRVRPEKQIAGIGVSFSERYSEILSPPLAPKGQLQHLAAKELLGAASIIYECYTAREVVQ
jgi:hypothetical protein